MRGEFFICATHTHARRPRRPRHHALKTPTASPAPTMDVYPTHGVHLVILTDAAHAGVHRPRPRRATARLAPAHRAGLAADCRRHPPPADRRQDPVEVQDSHDSCRRSDFECRLGSRLWLVGWVVHSASVPLLLLAPSSCLFASLRRPLLGLGNTCQTASRVLMCPVQIHCPALMHVAFSCRQFFSLSGPSFDVPDH